MGFEKPAFAMPARLGYNGFIFSAVSLQLDGKIGYGDLLLDLEWLC